MQRINKNYVFCQEILENSCNPPQIRAIFCELVVFDSVERRLMNNYDLDPIVAQYDSLFLDNDGTCAKTEELHAEVGTQILIAFM